VSETTKSAKPARRGGLIEAIRRANAPPPPENSVPMRIAVACAVFTGIAACESVGELSALTAVASAVAIALGMTFSFATRKRPWQWVKLLLAAAVIFVFVEFVVNIVGQAQAGNLASVEAPLAALFTWVQVVHSVDVPARRDLLFSLAASAALMAVAGAQAIDSRFGVYVAIWVISGVCGLVLSWGSMAGGRARFPFGTVAVCLLSVTLLGGVVVSFLPAPVAERVLSLPESITSYLALPVPGGLAGAGSSGTEPAQPGKPGGPIGVGGYVGFDGPLDTAARGALGNQVIFRVRATVPGYFLGMTYDYWNGQSWLQSAPFRATTVLTGGSPFQIPSPSAPSQTSQVPAPPPTQSPTQQNVQTFYVAATLPNLIFATAQPMQVWFPDRKLYVGVDGSIRTAIAMTPGTVYTVLSADDQRTPAELAGDGAPLSTAGLAPDLQLPVPDPYARVEALAEAVTAHATTLYGKVDALEGWMSTHVRYSTDIPPLLPGQDAVNQFLFGSRVGYCEQISTALTVMLRTLGIPAREAIGYVPGPFNPLTDLYEVQAKDAHAWVQVYFPGVGWQSFDPTADVPLAPPDPGAVLIGDLWGGVRNLPWLVIAPFGLALAGEEVARRWWRRRPRTWAERVARQLERAGARSGASRRATETLPEYAGRLQRLPAGGGEAGLRGAVAVLERTAYGGRQPDPGERLLAEEAVRRYRGAVRPAQRRALRRSSRRGRAGAGTP
jgi:protein-glutamine gamma-glutamyltransferase